jgi:hypothetical protein
MKIHKVVSVGSLKGFNPSAPILFLEIRFDGKRLSISGVEGPKKNGDALGGCGQVIDSLDRILTYCPGFDASKVAELKSVWARWHLNDMRAGCEHQESEQWGKRINPVDPATDPVGKPCPTCGYKYGTEWKFEQVPSDVIAFLDSLPATSLAYPWRMARETEGA